jgi:hypothetical protein
MTVAAAKNKERTFEIRVRFEPGLGAALYSSLKSGEVGPLTVARALGRGRMLLRYHGFTLMAHGAPEWKQGETFPVYVKQLGPPLVLARVGDRQEGASAVTTVDSAVVPGFEQRAS